jgi:hypothetical protein
MSGSIMALAIRRHLGDSATAVYRVATIVRLMNKIVNKANGYMGCP